MAHQSITDVVAKAKRDLEEARGKIEKLEVFLATLEQYTPSVSEQASDATTSPEPQASLSSPQTFQIRDVAYAEEIGALMKKTSGEFKVPEIVNIVLERHPEANYRDLSHKASNVALRLTKKAVLEVVSKGMGRNPNTYRAKQGNEQEDK